MSFFTQQLFEASAHCRIGRKNRDSDHFSLARPGALFAPPDPFPVSRHAGRLIARIRGVIKKGFADPDFGPHEVAAIAGISLRYLQKLCALIDFDADRLDDGAPFGDRPVCAAWRHALGKPAGLR